MSMAEEIVRLTEQIRILTDKLQEALDSIDSLRKENRSLQDSVEYYRKQLYGKSSEKTASLGVKDQIEGQLSLFDEAEITADPKEPEPDLVIQVKGYTKKRYKGQKKEKLGEIEHIKRICDLAEEDKKCDVCGSEMVEVGEVLVRTEMQFIPARVVAIDIYQKTYECRNCRKNGEKNMVSAPVPDPVLPHSLASPSTVAWVIHQKFEQAVPLYRQEKEWKDLGVEISRATMANWLLAVSRDWLHPMTARLREILLREHIIQADETPVQVLNEPKRENTTKSYMWVYSTNCHCKTPIRIFKYEAGRKYKFPLKFLEGFSGYLISDAYEAYAQIPGVKNCLCYIHLRRKFVDAITKNLTGVEETATGKGIAYCNRLLEIERTLADLSAEERKAKREELERPLLDEFFAWIEDTNCISYMGDKLRRALNYGQSHKEQFYYFLEDGDIAVHNQVCENAIRPFTIGRKNWLFTGSPKGAEASADIYSLIETAKANGLRPKKYIEYLLSVLPGMDFHNHPEYLDDLMPWAKEAQELCT